MMKAVQKIEAEVTLLHEAEGGRKGPLILAQSKMPYRPHLLVGDPDQRKEITNAEETKNYLGVAFLSGPEIANPGTSFISTMLLIYPEVDYSALVPGATFSIREGWRMVGYGRVTKRWTENST